MAPPLPPEVDRIVTSERLRILAWGYYLSGALGAAFACFFLLYAVIFGAMSFIPASEWGDNTPKQQSSAYEQHKRGEGKVVKKQNEPPPATFFRILSAAFVAVTIAGWALAAMTAYAGYCIHQRRHRLFVNIMAAYNCFWPPYGLALGVFTFIALNSAEAIRQFEAGCT